jgi:hypothetical protein
VPPVRSIDVAERRRRIVVRHAIGPSSRVGTATDAARAVVVLHATDPTSVFLAARARMREPTVEGIERELYDDRSLLRMLGMRRTMFTVPIELVPIVSAAASRGVAATERKRLLGRLETAAIGTGGERWLDELLDETVAALAARGEAVSTELSADVPGLRHQVRIAEGKAYAANQAISVWVLTLLSAEGRIVRARPRGTMVSSQYRWTTTERWLGGRIQPIPTDDARADLVRRWLERFGPGTIADLRWWGGWTAGAVKAALARLDLEDVDLDGASGLVLAGDRGRTPDPGRSVALLPALDPTTMGWQARAWYLGEHRPRLFDTNGNAGPTIWIDGSVVGGWAQRRDGEIATRLLEDVGREATAMAGAEAERLRAWLGDVRFTPRFRTPLERELVD